MSGQPDGTSQAVGATFETTFRTIMDGYKAAGELASKGASTTLLSVGSVALAASLVLKGLAAAGDLMLKGTAISGPDFAIMMGASVFLLVCGSAIRMWDRVLDERAADRDVRLRIDASERASAVAGKAAAIMMDAVKVPPATASSPRTPT